MIRNNRFLDAYLQIRSAAQESDDGQRCAVAPHPELLRQIKEEMERIRSSHRGVLRSVLRAEEPRHAGFNDGMIVPPQQFPIGTPLSVIRNTAAERVPLRGTVRIVVLLVDFEDQPFSETPEHFERLFFSLDEIPTQSVREYFRDVTHGLIDIQGEVVGPFRMPRTMEEYANNASGIGSQLPSARTMARDAARAADSTVNFTQYDNDGDGYVDAFIVVHAGPAGEVTGDPDHIWSHKWVLEGGEWNVDGTRIFAYLTVSEDAKIGVCCHELGHLVFGWPDLYDPDYSSEGVGNWCLMGGGSWGGGGDRPTHPSAWCKADQGWVTVENVVNARMLRLPDVKESHKVFRLWKDGIIGNEYFLVENRQQTGFDESLPSSGLLIWHIDDSISGNRNEGHYKVALMQADGNRDLELGRNRGDAGDAYPGIDANTGFTGTTTPNSHAYSGAPTGVSITNISPSAPVMTASVRVSARRPRRKYLVEGLDNRISQLESRLEEFLDRISLFDRDGQNGGGLRPAFPIEQEPTATDN